MDPALIYGPYGAIACLTFAVVWLARQNMGLQTKLDKLNEESRLMLQKYQERDKADKEWWIEQQRKASESRS